MPSHKDPKPRPTEDAVPRLVALGNRPTSAEKEVATCFQSHFHDYLQQATIPPMHQLHLRRFVLMCIGLTRLPEDSDLEFYMLEQYVQWQLTPPPLRFNSDALYRWRSHGYNFELAV